MKIPNFSLSVNLPFPLPVFLFLSAPLCGATAGVMERSLFYAELCLLAYGLSALALFCMDREVFLLLQRAAGWRGHGMAGRRKARVHTRAYRGRNIAAVLLSPVGGLCGPSTCSVLVC